MKRRGEQKTRASQPTSRRKTPGVKTAQPCVNSTKNPPPGDQCLAFPNPLSTNHIVQAFYIRAQSPLWVVKNRDLTIGAVCGKVCALAQVAVESSPYRSKVRKVSSISSDMQSLLRHKLPLGATPCDANGTGSSRSFQPQVNSPHLGRGANL